MISISVQDPIADVIRVYCLGDVGDELKRLYGSGSVGSRAALEIVSCLIVMQVSKSTLRCEHRLMITLAVA